MSDFGSLDQVDHIGFVFKDIGKIMELISSTLDIGPWHMLDFAQTENELIVGEPFKLKEAFIKVGGIVIELIQPVEGRSVWSYFVESGREGIHHLAFTVSNWENVVLRMREHGSRIMVGGLCQGKRWCYMEAERGDLVIELMDNFGMLEY